MEEFFVFSEIEDKNVNIFTTNLYYQLNIT